MVEVTLEVGEVVGVVHVAEEDFEVVEGEGEEEESLYLIVQD